jgi:SAM-dependent methyltransferase
MGDMTHHHEPADLFTREFWDDRYGSDDQIWSGQPNPHLVTYASELRPGTALDLGSGEGADAIWLARQGWQVTGLDVSPVALDRAAGRAAKSGVGDRVTWGEADALTWTADGTYDLVAAHFMHFLRPAWRRLHERLAAAVAPGGTLLVVGHHPDDGRHADEDHDYGDVRFTADEVAASLEPGDWTTIDALRLEREQIDRDGHAAIAVDAVLRAVRAR